MRRKDLEVGKLYITRHGQKIRLERKGLIYHVVSFSINGIKHIKLLPTLDFAKEVKHGRGSKDEQD